MCVPGVCHVPISLDTNNGVKALSYDEPGIGITFSPKDATELKSASRRLRLGRAYKQHLPDTLRPFADMENQEWVRLEEYLLEVRLRAQEQREREQGRIMVEMDTGDTTRTQYDHFGRKRVSFSGGTLL